MGKATGFLEYERHEDPWILPKARIRGFEEFHEHLLEDERRCQAARCMDCGVPMCQSAISLKGMVTGCPLHNLIPEWNDEIYKGHFEHALSRLLQTSSFPEFTGRVCPALCEKACINGLCGEPVTIHDNELFLIEKGFEEGWMKPFIPPLRSGKRVAVVGAGPGGLAAADRLNKRGHTVTVYEREDEIGGLLMYGIPNMKLDKKVILRRRKLMEEEGVVFKTGVDVGKDLSFEELVKDNDAVILSCGAKKARDLSVEGRNECRDIYFAVDFLKSATKDVLAGKKDKWTISAKGKNVVIVGGGDTGNDCLGTCIRQGAKNVVQIEMMPKPPEERSVSNPWPEWPKVLKTDYGQQEAIEVFGSDPRIYETTVKELRQEKGKLSSIKTVRVAFKDKKLEEVKGSEKEIECDLLIIAAGFLGCEDYIAKAANVALTERGVVDAKEGKYQTSVEKVFAAGDMRRGQSLVVWAIAEGRHCAAAVDEYLMGYTPLI